MNVTPVGPDRAEKLTHSLVTESDNDVNGADRHLGYDAVSRLGQRMKRTFSSVRVSCAVALRVASGVAATSIRYKGEYSEDEKEAKPSEERPT